MSGRVYYNEIDPFASDWLRNLIDAGHIAPGDVDTRSIVDVRPGDLDGYTQVHLFAGIGGWSYALRLAGWPDDRPVWTGSCPCPPFSSAGKKKRCPECGGKPIPHPRKTGVFACIDCAHEWLADGRHLWPEMLRLIEGCQRTDAEATAILGEQVAGQDGLVWLAGVRATLEALGHAVGASDLCAAGVGAPHIRQRLFWMAHAEGCGQRGRSRACGGDWPQVANDRVVCGLGHTHDDRWETRSETASTNGHGNPAFSAGGGTCWMGEPIQQGPQRHAGDGDHRDESGWINADTARSVAPAGNAPGWSDCIVVPCADGKLRRVSAQSGDEPLAHGIPVRMGPMLARLDGMGRGAIKAARRNRNSRIHGYGNAIVPQVAAEFIQAAISTLSANVPTSDRGAA